MRLPTFEVEVLPIGSTITDDGRTKRPRSGAQVKYRRP